MSHHTGTELVLACFQSNGILASATISNIIIILNMVYITVPCSLVTIVFPCFFSVNSMSGSFLRSVLVPTSMIGAFGQWCATSGNHWKITGHVIHKGEVLVVVVRNRSAYVSNIRCCSQIIMIVRDTRCWLGTMEMTV